MVVVCDVGVVWILKGGYRVIVPPCCAQNTVIFFIFCVAKTGDSALYGEDSNSYENV